jgi:type II secretory pathway component PulC
MVGMKLQLWIINSFLVLLFLLTLILGQLLEQEVPVVSIAPVSFERKKIEVTPVVAAGWEKIYQADVFDTYVKPVVEITKPSLVTPVPEPAPAQVISPPDPKLPSFIDPLTVTLKGIIVTGDEQRSAAMIADETNKERMYYLGDKIKDAQIIKIVRNRIVLLRANGQQESFYLIKEDMFAQPTEKWANIVKKINDQQYKIDPHAFKLEVESLGNFIERAGVLGTSYSKGNPIGVRIGDIKDRDVATNLGLVQNDVITSINGIGVSNIKERMQLYDAILRMKIGDTISVKMLRAGNEVSINYELSKFPRISRSLTAVEGQEPKKGGPETLPMNPLQERENRMREFAKRHAGGQRDQRMASDMRSRFLENLREKMKRARERVVRR